MTRLARATAAKYAALRVAGRACFRRVGGLEVATTRERLADLRRRHGWATAAGIDSRLLEPAECAGLHPLIERDAVLGGLHVPSDGLAVPLGAAEAQAAAAAARGAEFRHGVRVTGIDTTGGRVRAVETTQGRVEAEVVVAAAGMWGPLVGAMAGVPVPLSPMAHQYAWTTPLRELDVLQKLRGLLDPVDAMLPILRHQDAGLYLREHGDRLGVGAHGHRAMPAEAAGLDRPGPDRGETPSERAFTALDFEPSWAAAQALVPALDDAKVERGVNGLFSFTPDGMPLLGETDVPGLWLAEAVWITHSAGVAQAVASWMVDGVPSLPALGGEPGDAEPVDVSAAHHDRFDPALLAPATVRSRACAAFDEVYAIAHPHGAQPGAAAARRAVRRPPPRARRRRRRARRLGGPRVVRRQRRPARGLRGPPAPRVGGSALVDGRRRRGTRRAAGGGPGRPRPAGTASTSPGPNALGLLQQLTTSDLDRPVGTRTRTLCLDRSGGSAPTSTSRDSRAEHFAVGAATRLEVRWLAEHALGDVTITDVSAGTCAVGVWGPAAGVLLSRLTDPADRDHRGRGPHRTSAPYRSSCCAAPPRASTAWSCAPPPTSVPRCGTCSGTRAPPSAWSPRGNGPSRASSSKRATAASRRGSTPT